MANKKLNYFQVHKNKKNRLILTEDKKYERYKRNVLISCESLIKTFVLGDLKIYESFTKTL